MNKKEQIAQAVLKELDQFENFSAGQYQAPKFTPHAVSQTLEIHKSNQHIEQEPFISYIRVREQIEDGDWKERIYLVCRNYTPSVNPVDPSGTFLNRNAPAGTIASGDVGDEIEIMLPRPIRKLRKTVVILEKNTFTPHKNIRWDAVNNNMFYRLEEEFIPSLRDITGSITEYLKPAVKSVPEETLIEENSQLPVINVTAESEPQRPPRKPLETAPVKTAPSAEEINPGIVETEPEILELTDAEILVLPIPDLPAPTDDILDLTEIGRELIREIEEAENLSGKFRALKNKKNQRTLRAIVESISLKDRPLLDKSQDKYCRLPLSSQILLTGSPGTGKTTTLIKRIVFKSDNLHLSLTDEFELDHHRLKNWLMFTPNELLKMYLKEAMNKEGLSATDNKVVTWEKERTILGRDVLKFLKSPKSGMFWRTGDEIFRDNTSSDLIRQTTRFVNFFNAALYQSFAEAIAVLERNKPNSDITAKETAGIARDYSNFIYNCQNILRIYGTRRISDPDIKTLYLLNDFQPLKSQLTKLRANVGALIKNVLDNLIMHQPQIIEQVSELINHWKTLAEQQQQPADSSEPSVIVNEEPADTEEVIEDEDILDGEEIADEETEDIRIEAKRQIRQALVKFSESLALKGPLKNKRQLQIWELLAPSLTDTNQLTFIGQINIALRQRIFGQLDYSRFLEQIPVFYDKFRQSLIKGKESRVPPKVVEIIKGRKVSLNETDILIFVILKFAAKIFQEKREFLEDDSKIELLENIKSRYRTQIAVDEAADFSAVQLGCMFYLAHPEFKSVSFAGDLMQRVTYSGITSWKECEFISDKLKEQELKISYRQTPILLQIAGKLYESVIGTKPPFRSKTSKNNHDPRPLKFKADDEEALGDWIARRVYEIYEINGSKLPSIAIFVPEEDDIDWAYKIINEKLNDISIDVEKCSAGKVLGTDSRVRIFSVEYVKGLEFEGVFFLGIDEIYRKKPDLIDKYLYVGLTRATTFLGVTYKTEFPSKIQFIKDDFSDGNWSEFIQ